MNDDLTALDHLRALQKLAQGPAPKKQPDALPPSKIEVCPALFQPRGGLTEHHIQALLRALRQDGELEPILVIQIGRKTVVVDGHHRLEAYKAAKRKAVPVTYFTGNLDQAVLVGGTNNSRVKLPMNGIERQDFAWRLVTLGSAYSKRDIVRASGVSDGQVGNMRRAATKLGPEAKRFTSWFLAREAALGKEQEEWSPEDREVWEEEQAQLLAEKLSRAWGPRGIRHPQIAAMALEKYFGRTISKLGEHLAGHMPDPEQLADDEVLDF